MARALGAVTPEDAKGFFAHSGYEIEAQPPTYPKAYSEADSEVEEEW